MFSVIALLLSISLRNGDCSDHLNNGRGEGLIQEAVMQSTNLGSAFSQWKCSHELGRRFQRLLLSESTHISSASPRSFAHRARPDCYRMAVSDHRESPVFPLCTLTADHAGSSLCAAWIRPRFVLLGIGTTSSSESSSRSSRL